MVNVPPRHRLHLFRRQVADGVGQLNQWMAFHALCAKLEDGRILEGCCNHDGGRDAALLELDGVVHTAQRAGPSPADGGDGDLDLLGDLINQGFQEQPAENVRLEGTDLLAYRILCCENSILDSIQSLEPTDEYAPWHGDLYRRVAKNPMKVAEVSVLIFQGLRTGD